MLITRSLGAAPNLSTTAPSGKCTTVDAFGICIQSLNIKQPPAPGAGGGLVSSFNVQPLKWNQLPFTPGNSMNPTIGPSTVGGGGGSNTTPPASPPTVQPPEAPSQQPPPAGLPEQPTLQPGVTVSNVLPDGSIAPSSTGLPFGMTYKKLGLVVGGVVLAAATIATVIGRARRSPA